MSLLDTHTNQPATHQSLYGRTVTLQHEDLEIEIVAIWNDISSLAGMRGIADVEVDKASIIINKKIEIDNEISVAEGWRVIGSPNDVDANETFIIDKIKEDRQHQVKICFLKSTKDNTWDNEI